jgi:hypothetical protein
MVSTLSLMAASLLLGQSADVPAQTPLPPSTKVYVYNNGVLVPASNAEKASFVGQTTTEDNHPILTRIQSWFTRRSSDRNSETVVSTPMPASASAQPVSVTTTTMPTATTMVKVQTAPAQAVMSPTAGGDAYPRKMPAAYQSAPSNSDVMVVTTNSTPPSAVAGSALPAPSPNPILPANANRIGRDEKFGWITGQLAIEKNQYVLYYATPETVDTYHGRILLNPQKVDMRNYHNGDLISVHGHLSAGHGTAIYQLTGADLIDRAKR